MKRAAQGGAVHVDDVGHVAVDAVHRGRLGLGREVMHVLGIRPGVARSATEAGLEAFAVPLREVGGARVVVIKDHAIDAVGGSIGVGGNPCRNRVRPDVCGSWQLVQVTFFS